MASFDAGITFCFVPDLAAAAHFYGERLGRGSACKP